MWHNTRPRYGYISDAEAANPCNNVALYCFQAGGAPPWRGTTVRRVWQMPAPADTVPVQALVRDLLALAAIDPEHLPYAECFASPLAAPLSNSCPFPEGPRPTLLGRLGHAVGLAGPPATALIAISDGAPALRLGASDATPIAAALGALRLTTNANDVRYSIVERLTPRELEALVGFVDIGVFVAADDARALAAPGAAWLQGPHLPSPLPPPSAVAAAVAALQPSGAAPAPLLLPPAPALELVPAPARAALVALIDAAWAACSSGAGAGAPAAAHPLAAAVAAACCRDDFKLLLQPAALAASIGEGAAEALAAALGGPPHAIALRRTAATGRWINLHTDAAGATVQVPLSGDEACEGGRLVFAEAGGALRSPARTPGVPLAHSGDQVHGVTRLLRGVRYGLFLLRAR